MIYSITRIKDELEDIEAELARLQESSLVKVVEEQAKEIKTLSESVRILENEKELLELKVAKQGIRIGELLVHAEDLKGVLYSRFDMRDKEIEEEKVRLREKAAAQTEDEHWANNLSEVAKKSLAAKDKK